MLSHFLIHVYFLACLIQGKKSKVSTSRQTQVATNMLSKAAFLLTVLSERLELHNLAFSTGMFSLELQRPPASTKALEVSLTHTFALSYKGFR